jgi:cytoskeletal protein RodZ
MESRIGGFSSPNDLPDLASIRESRGISLAQIAEATKIAPHYLRAIERAEFQKLPGGLFTTSYLRQYARAIAYDESDLLACYRSLSEPPALEPPNPGWRVPIPWLRAARKA